MDKIKKDIAIRKALGRCSPLLAKVIRGVWADDKYTKEKRILRTLYPEITKNLP